MRALVLAAAMLSLSAAGASAQVSFNPAPAIGAVVAPETSRAQGGAISDAAAGPVNKDPKAPAEPPKAAEPGKPSGEAGK